MVGFACDEHIWVELNTIQVGDENLDRSTQKPLHKYPGAPSIFPLLFLYRNSFSNH